MSDECPTALVRGGADELAITTIHGRHAGERMFDACKGDFNLFIPAESRYFSSLARSHKC
jgi:hypothetical protein